MKNSTLLLSMFMIVIGLTAKAQSGNWYLGGTTYFHGNNTKLDDDDLSSFNVWEISPEIGTNITDDFQFGLNVGFSSTITKQDDEEYTYTLTMPSIYGRYLFEAGDKLDFFAGLNFAYGWGKQSRESSDLELKENQFETSLNAGLLLALSERWSIVGNIGLLRFTHTELEVDDDVVKQNDFSFGLSMQAPVGFGVYYTFKK